MNLRKLLIPFFFCLASSSFAQSISDNTYYSADSTTRPAVVPKRMHVGLELGTGISTNFRGSSGFHTFVSPYLSYRVSPRWTVQAGATIVNGNFFGTPNGDYRYAVPMQQQTFLFAQGQYQASERLSITGTTFYQSSLLSRSERNAQRNLGFANKGMSIYAEYKVTENFSFGVGARYSEGNTPYLNRGIGGSGFGYPTGAFNPYW